MKKIAVLSYKIIFDPSEAWSSGYQFEAQLADFFAAHGFEAQIVAPAGGTGDRVIWLEREFALEVPKRREEPAQAPKQIKQIQTSKPTRAFKQFQSRGVPKAFVNQERRPARTTFQTGRDNRQKVRRP